MKAIAKTANLAKDLYPIAALPLLMFMAIQVYNIAQDNAKKTQEILSLQKALDETKEVHRHEIDDLEKQVDFLIKKLIDKSATIKLPYTPTLQLNFHRHKTNMCYPMHVSTSVERLWL